MPILTMLLNGSISSVLIEPGELLADVLRDKLHLIGTKIGCGEGECGACTVLVDGLAVASCIYPALKAAGRQVTTIEGLQQDGKLHAIQEAFVECTASQCGYCTPGMIMSAYALLNENSNPSVEEIKESISGNLCRCTGYYQIVEAIQSAAQKLAEEGGAS